MKIWIRRDYVIILAVCLCVDLSAFYVGNPSEPSAIETGVFLAEDSVMTVKVGYQGDVVFDSRLQASGGVQGTIDSFQLRMNQGVLTLDILDRFEVYGTVGSMNAYLSHRPSIDHRKRDYQSREAVTWTVGGRAILFQWKHTSIGIQGGGQWGNPPIRWNTLSGVSLNTHAALRYRQWQVAFGASHQLGSFIPYMAAKYSYAHAVMSRLRSNLDLGSSWFTMRNRSHFGLILGCTVIASKIFDLTGEVRLVDEEAVSLSANFKF